MTLYKGTQLIAGSIPDSVNKSLSNLDSTGQAIIDSKADTDLSNLSSTGKTVIDGEIVGYFAQLYNNGDLNGNPIIGASLDFLPDNGKYFVLFSAEMASSTTSHQYAAVQLSSSLTGNNYSYVCRCVTRVSSVAAWAAGSLWLPVENKSYNIYRSTNYHGTFSLFAIAYRRIGNNS